MQTDPSSSVTSSLRDCRYSWLSIQYHHPLFESYECSISASSYIVGALDGCFGQYLRLMMLRCVSWSLCKYSISSSYTRRWTIMIFSIWYFLWSQVNIVVHANICRKIGSVTNVASEGHFHFSSVRFQLILCPNYDQMVVIPVALFWYSILSVLV